MENISDQSIDLQAVKCDSAKCLPCLMTNEKHEISVGAATSDLSLRFRNGLGTIFIL